MQAVQFGTGHRAMMPYDWEGNRGSGEWQTMGIGKGKDYD